MSKYPENKGTNSDEDHEDQLINLSDSSNYIQIQLSDYDNSHSTSSLISQQLENLECIVIFPGNDAHVPISVSNNGDQSCDHIISMSTPSLSECLASTLQGASITNTSLTLPAMKHEKRKKPVITKLINSDSSPSDLKNQNDSSTVKSNCLVSKRVSHNEVERRRRDQINTWIGELQSMLPDDIRQKSYHQSKGIILKTVAEYFKGMQKYLTETQEMQTKTKQIELQNAVLKESMAKLREENDQLKIRLEHLKHDTSNNS